jgi:hypothetical protein
LPLIALMSADQEKSSREFLRAIFAGVICGRNLRTMRINI